MTAPMQPLHATAVARHTPQGWTGVLIQGPSGVGKSDLALRLIGQGWRLVADDWTHVWASDGALYAAAPTAITGKIEVRGLGIVEQAHVAPVPLALAVRLSDRYDRMPSVNQVETVAGHPLPALLLSAFEASAPIKILLALDHLAPHS